jgi:catechol 2,3-dioxygenase-like lactoylglutathione lyase family enzyme
VHKTWLPVGVALAVTYLAQPAPSRPPVLGLAHVRVMSADLARAKRFYGDLLGLPEVPQASSRVAIFRVNEQQHIIVRVGLPPDRDDRFVDVAWETSDLAAMRVYLRGRGIDAHDADDAGEGQGAALEMTDPDGHRVRVIQLSTSPLSDRSPDRRISRRIQHAGLTVRSAQPADAFYKDALGFSEIWRGGRPEGTINWINMRVPEGTAYLEYMLTPSPPDRRQLGTAHHIALLVPDIQTALETIRSRTDASDPNHRAVPQIGVNRRWQLNVYDPDGTRVELMEPWTVR